jgi:dephospho-CoA kinase
MYVVGLTGGIGSGKSTVADLFVARGAALVDTDALAHELTAPGGAAMPALEARFGQAIVRADGGLDRAAMRRRVFADPAEKQALEAILHPLIRAESDRRCAAAVMHDAPYVILAVPLLVESGSYRARCDRILVVDCDPEVQVARVMARSALPESEVRAIIATQATRAARRAVADDVIDNSGAPAALSGQVDALHHVYLAAALTKVKANC